MVPRIIFPTGTAEFLPLNKKNAGTHAAVAVAATATASCHVDLERDVQRAYGEKLVLPVHPGPLKGIPEPLCRHFFPMCESVRPHGSPYKVLGSKSKRAAG